jgi:ATP-dependent Clp protease protease subunit
MHAWVNDAGDPEAKASYKFPHHAAGTDTAANINGVNNALARLSQADIPDGDRSGVKAHLNAHRRDAGLEDYVEDHPEDQVAPVVASVSQHEPIRCFEGTAKPHEPFWRFVDAAETDSGEPELEFYGYISEYSWWEDEISPRLFKDQLYANGGGGPITIRMDSGGGDPIAASTIRAIIQDYPGRVTVRIDGIAASAATIVATAGDHVTIQDTAYYMIHDPLAIFFMAALNIEDLKRLTDTLQTVKDGILNAYMDKTGLARGRLSNMMTEETWMSAQEAVNLGFVDEIVAKKPKASAKIANVAFVNALIHYQHVPDALRAQITEDVPGDLPDAQVPALQVQPTPREELRHYLDTFYERRSK